MQHARDQNTLRFFKYQAAGNDFVVIDDRKNLVTIDPHLVASLCHRYYGVGGDGLLLVTLSEVADYKMRIFNADGSEAPMCGNGLKSFIQYLHDFVEQKSWYAIEVGGMIYHANYNAEFENGRSTIEMKVASFDPFDEVSYFIDTGVPHFVRFTEDLTPFDHQAKRDFLRFGININYVKLDAVVQEADEKRYFLEMRTFERGVGETRACGTGATAVVAGLIHYFGLYGQFFISFPHGESLSISTENVGNSVRVFMEGEGKYVFQGMFPHALRPSHQTH